MTKLNKQNESNKQECIENSLVTFPQYINSFNSLNSPGKLTLSCFIQQKWTKSLNLSGLPFNTPSTTHLKIKLRGTCVTQSVKCPTSLRIMISWFVGLGPESGSVLTTRSLEPASDSRSPSLSLLLPCSFSLKNK